MRRRAADSLFPSDGAAGSGFAWNTFMGVICVSLLAVSAARSQTPAGIRELNQVPVPEQNRVTAILGGRLVDGQGGLPIADSAVVVWGKRIVSAGVRGAVPVPPDARTIDAGGLTILPGFIDAHFHLGRAVNDLPRMFLEHGVTSVRDPGAWIEKYEPLLPSKEALPRLFLTGPHFDTAPPAYPKNSILINDLEEGRRAVERFVEQGASAIKVYFRLPLETIRAVCEAAHLRGVPVTAHLELVRADDAIRAGIDGIEHVTSLGTALSELQEAEAFRQAVTADNDARREGRYELWSKIDLSSPRAAKLIDLIAKSGTFLSPNLAVFERQLGDKDTTEMHIRAHRNMMRFVGMASEAGARVVVGSHSNVPHAERGWAYHREMELLVNSGMSPRQAIVAATSENARFFRIEDRLGSIEPGKLADLVLVEGNPLGDIRAVRRIRGVMLNGRWVVEPSP